MYVRPTRTLITAALFSMLAQAATPKTAAPPPKPAAERRAAQAMLRSLTLHDRIAQLVIGAWYGDVPGLKSKEYEKFRHWVRDVHIGGLILVNRSQYGLVRTAEPHAAALFLNQMQKLARVPLLVGGDFERGASMRVGGTTRFPHAMAFAAARDVEASRREGLMTAREARALGVQWVFAPVSDVNNNPDNPVINIRSYGENPEEVAAHVSAFIEGAHSDPKNPVLVSAKHFPGHGDTSIDSHLDLARLAAARDRMDAVELKPFQAAIAHGVDSIMTAHMTVPAIEPDEIPATVSRRVLTGLLREELGFSGLIVTDAMDMAGLAKQFSPGEAAVRSLQAGADVLLMPPNPELAIRAVMAAVANGRISRKRIDESALRVLEAKVRVGLTKKKLVDLEAISDATEPEEEMAEAQSIADRAVTLVRNDSSVVPLTSPAQACVVISSGLRLSVFGQRMAEEFRRRAPQARVMFVNNGLPAAALDAMIGDPASCSAIVFATFTTDLKMNGDLSGFVQKLTAGPVPVVFVSFGNPYLLAQFPNVRAYIAAFTTATPAESSVVKALFGEMPIVGRLPVTIPGLAQYGEGIQLPVTRTRFSPSAQ
jgi:beta-N-acetylhexosaminidase